ncbi:hypothetical protein [Parvicella tangerina]|uniref:Thioredoxin domain-containing protein n=1 Tax=Parvicella tangerina TaxID=2829795 RepID=A0A916NPZ5_9FLAO|nr:hypothetical protein [Parvicella tangerina]CAG5077889.1 hypothetical protein CRYO30217_00508 [Parvicella tangerina]
MSTVKYKLLTEWLIRSGIALSVIAFGVSRHLFGLEESTGSLLESGLASSSQMALLGVHVITLLELIFVAITLTARFNKGYLWLAISLGAFYTLSYFFSWKNTVFLNADLTNVLGLSGCPFVILCVVLLGFTYGKLKEGKKVLPSWATIGVIVLLITGYTTYYGDTVSDFKNQGSEYAVKYAKWDVYWEDLEDQQPEFLQESTYTLCFFSTSCSHCAEAARRISVYQKKYPENKLLGVFFAKSADGEFWNSDERVEDFFERTSLKIPFIKMIDYQVVSIADNQFPVIIRMEDKKPQSIYVGAELNAWAFDHLFK